MEDIISKMLSVKKQFNNDETNTQRTQLPELVTQMLFNLVNLRQRKELCKHRVKLEQSKKKLLETIANRKKFLSSLPSHLKTLKKASLPVQNQLGIQHTKKLKQYHLAGLLPPPLYGIYSQLLAQKEAFAESIDLEIIGGVKDAQAYARQQANKDSGKVNLIWIDNYLMNCMMLLEKDPPTF